MANQGTAKIFVLDPTVPPRELLVNLAPRPARLGGGTVGFLWNSKPNGDLLFARIEVLLREKYEISEVIHRSKQTASIPAPLPVLEELAAGAQVAIVGLGD